MIKKKLVAVLIPLYKKEMSFFEKRSFKQCFSVLHKYPIIIVKPISLNISCITEEYKECMTASFSDFYFESIKGYNALLTSTEFYEKFLEYEYILIHQLDAYVFKDELSYWCQKNYDYIGAPWGPKYTSGIGKIKLLLLQWIAKYIKAFYKYTRYNKVGNGGFSLRKTKTFYTICLDMFSKRTHKTIIPSNPYTENEDFFWSIEVNEKEKKIKTPPLKEALLFSIEHFPEKAIQMNNNILPFGCHGWYKNKKWLTVWKKYITLE
ncbi:MAG: DUF5672 family protein [Chitinophagaceae bacterium]|nr:DUF5672 family protein [Chitinophagaceae bacterium]